MALYPNAQWKGPVPNMTRGAMTGYRFIVLHMMEGTLAGTDSWFHQAASQASSHFGVGKDGTVYQWVDTADKAWAEAGGNAISVSIEHEGSTGDTLTAEQVTADGKLLAWIYTTHNILLQITDDSINGQGLIGHSEGGAAWGNHGDPGDAVLGQRQAMIDAAGPFVVSVYPSIGGNPAGGTPVWVLGTGFTGATAVTFGTTAVATVTPTSGQISTTAPPGTGVVDITVTTPVGTSPKVTADQFGYASGVPTITNFSPTQGDPQGGTIVVIVGTNLGGTTEVYFGATPSVTSNPDSETRVTALSPPGAGSVQVSLVTVLGNAVGTSSFTYVAPSPPPQVYTVSPTDGTTLGGTSVVIMGAAFTGAAGVSFGATPATSFNVDTDTQITAVSPASAAGIVDIAVTTAAATSSAGLGDQYSFTPPQPVISGINPSSGPATGATAVTITGSGFTGATTVGFGNTAAPSMVVVNDAQITTVSPIGVGTVDITVFGEGGTSQNGPTDQFTYASANAPVVTALAPDSGSAGGGDTIVITGTGFIGAIAVSFGSNSGTIVSIDSDTQITAKSPAGALTVDVTVTTAIGTSPATASDKFTYATASLPQITSIAPTSGASAGGDVVTITGTGFAGATGVDFGVGNTAIFSVDSDTQLSAVAPAGTNTVDIIVTTATGTSPTSPADQFTFV